MTSIDKQSRLPDRFWVTVSPGVRALGEDMEGHLIDVAQRIFQIDPSFGFGDEARTTVRDGASEVVVVWTFDRLQCKPDAAKDSGDAHSVALTLKLASEC